MKDIIKAFTGLSVRMLAYFANETHGADSRSIRCNFGPIQYLEVVYPDLFTDTMPIMQIIVQKGGAVFIVILRNKSQITSNSSWNQHLSPEPWKHKVRVVNNRNMTLSNCVCDAKLH
jgi:hypothetical protein